MGYAEWNYPNHAFYGGRRFLGGTERCLSIANSVGRGASDFSGQVLEKVVEYLQWHARNQDRSEFSIKDFERKIPPEPALELYVDPTYCS